MLFGCGGEQGEWLHPIYGSVLYLTVDGGGPTLIVEQTKDGRRPHHRSAADVNGTLVTPQRGAYARWRGDRLHAVLPPSPPRRQTRQLSEQSPAPPPQLAMTIAEQILAVYSEHNPTMVDKVPGLLTKYAGHEAELLESIMEKYDITEVPQHLDPSPPPPASKEEAKKFDGASDEFTERITLTVAYWANHRCASRGETECIDDRYARNPE